ncbi:peptidoglycan-binding protein [Actinoplanes sp. NPDC051851]|uniref:efflux RND transporter periplasmic adaptor subunit n=1 Tax=Actinoplanes sp. NPDC051851 TaxID=3154753 RepID=UPI00344A826B
MSRRWTTAGIAAAVIAVGAGGYVFATGLGGNENGAAQASSTLPAATADVTKETLIDQESHDGSLAYADTSSIGTRLSGTVTGLAAAGSTVKRGQALFKIDNRPVLLLYGSLPAYRALAPGVEGADVKQFEKNLWALGYRGFTVDDEYTGATADAVEEWQEDRGLDETGTVELGRVVYGSGAVRVTSLSAELGSTAQPGTAILTTSGMGRVATVELDVDDQRLAKKGTSVDVTLPDGSTVKGKITEIETVVEESDSPDGDDTTKIDVTIAFSKAPQGLDEAAVSVEFVASQRKDVLTVPVNALLALAEGGYGLQVVDGTSTRTIAVETGLFADGRVEVSGGGVAEGMKVGVPE